MPRDHHLPAAYIGRFSKDPHRPVRTRTVWIADKRSNRIFATQASRICAVNDLYTTPGGALLRAEGEPVSYDDTRVVDRAWVHYEASLYEAIDDLVAGTLDAQRWASVLVEFVAALLVRGPDFDERLRRRFTASPGSRFLSILAERPDNTNLVRLMELQRLRPSLISAMWTVLATTGKLPQFTNDLGFVAYQDTNSASRGIVVPLDTYHALTIRPTSQRHVVATAINGTWRPRIAYARVDEAQQRLLLSCVARSAQRFVIGPSEASMRGYWVQEHRSPPVPEPGLLGFLPPAMSRHYELLFARLATELSRAPRANGEELYVDLQRNMPP